MFAVIVVLLLVILIYMKVIKPHSYWSDHGIKQTKPFYLLGDNAGPILKRESHYNMLRRIYNEFNEDRYFGMYQMANPTLCIRDPDLIKTVTVKDFDYFVDHRPFFPRNSERIWTKNIFSLEGNEWRQMRATLSPSFTSSKMKGIFTLINECVEIYVKHFQQKNGTPKIELRDIFTRYTNDVIASVCYGIQCDSINDRENEFYKRAGEMINIDFGRMLKFFAYSLFPEFCKLIGLNFFPEKANRFFEKIITDTIKIRAEKGIFRGDMVDLLIQAREHQIPQDQNKLLELSDEDIAAQAFIFFLGGYESVATVLSFMGYELAIHPQIQKKLQREIDETLKESNGSLTYELIFKMKYMDMVVSETLRKYPPNAFLDRVCTKPYTIAPVHKNEKTVHLKPGDLVLVSTYGLHYDDKYFPQPYEFKPERFSDENKEEMNSDAYLPFGLGPRFCIGSRLALLKIKTLYFHLLTHFDIISTDKTEVPLKMSKNTFTLLSQNGVWVGLRPRNK